VTDVSKKAGFFDSVAPERKFHPQKTHRLAEASQAFEMFLARRAAAFANFV
jgi:hypothetical protein